MQRNLHFTSLFLWFLMHKSVKLYFVSRADSSQIGRFSSALFSETKSMPSFICLILESVTHPLTPGEKWKKIPPWEDLSANIINIRDLLKYFYACVCEGWGGFGRSLEVLFPLIPGILIKYSGSGPEFRDCGIPSFLTYSSEYHGPFIDNNVVIKWIDKCLDHFFRMKSYRS